MVTLASLVTNDDAILYQIQSSHLSLVKFLFYQLKADDG